SITIHTPHRYTLLPYTTLFRSVEDDHTLVVELEQPTEYFLELTAFHTYYPISMEEVTSENEDWSLDQTEGYVSNGPFEMTSWDQDRKSTRLNSSHVSISYAVFC